MVIWDNNNWKWYDIHVYGFVRETGQKLLFYGKVQDNYYSSVQPDKIKAFHISELAFPGKQLKLF